MNHLYMVSDRAARYVFRVYTHGWRTAKEISEEVRLLEYLHGQGVPVSYPIADSQGCHLQHFDAIEGVRMGVMYSYAPGRKMPLFSADLACRAGAALGALHRCTRDMHLERANYDFDTLVTDSVATVKKFFGEQNEDVQFLQKAGDYVQRTVFAGVLTMKQGVVHMDGWFDNMHFDDNGQVTLFDFDFCGVGAQGLDIAYFLYQLFSTNYQTGGYEEKAAAFLKGYSGACDFQEGERENIAGLALAVMLYYIGVQCAKYDTWSNIFLNEDHLKRYVASLKRWLSYHRAEV